jgi:hypothetical protein
MVVAVAEEREKPTYGPEGGEPSDKDALGLDKRRHVVGGQYGASKQKQLAIYGGFLVFSVIVVIGFLTVVSSIDNKEMPLENTAPWAQSAAPQEAPRDIDFPANGPVDTIPEDEIGEAVPARGGNGTATDSGSGAG